jgi:threonine dehydratase
MVSFSDIQDAYNRIQDHINHTPVLTSYTINNMLNAQVYFKCENFQKVGAFKFRGAFNAISQLSEKQKQRGVITHSSGNHAQAVALAAKMLRIKATIVMPKNSPKVKLRATRDTYKARVEICESTVKSRQETCDRIMAEEGQTLIHPYDNDQIIAGAGTAAYELLKSYPDLDVIIAPVGGGGLLSGTAITTKSFNNQIHVYAGEPERANDAYRSFHSGQVKHNKNPDTIADGLRTDLSERTFKYIRNNVDQIVTVSEREILQAMRLIWERMKIIVEPSSAVPLAALFGADLPIQNKKIGLIISGGNVDASPLFESYNKQIESK